MNFSSNNLKKHVEVILLNKRIFLILFFSFMFLAFVEKQELDESQRESVYEFINCFKDDDGKEKLAALVHFPLKRRYPLPDINNAKEFLERIDDMFDEKLIQMIVKSDIDEDWSIVGFRGIMLHHGVLWLGLDGKLISVNYQSEVEEKKRMR